MVMLLGMGMSRKWLYAFSVHTKFISEEKHVHECSSCS